MYQDGCGGTSQQYHASRYGAGCFGSLDHAIAGTEKIATLVPDSDRLIMERLLIMQRLSVASAVMYVQVSITSLDGARSVMWCRWSPFIENLHTKGKKLGASVKLQATRKTRMGLRRTRAIAHAIDKFWQEGWSWELAAIKIQQAFMAFKQRWQVQNIAATNEMYKHKITAAA
jgi:hypothetical protein